MPLMSSNIAAGAGVTGLLRGKQRVPLGLHRLDLLEQQFEPIEFTADLGLEMRRQRTAIAGLQLVEPFAVDRDAAARSRIRPARTAIL